MKTTFRVRCWLSIVATTSLCCCAVQAGTRASANYAISADVADIGGQHLASANYAMDTSVGAVAGLSSNAVPLEILKHGYIGQLSEVTNASIVSSSLSVNSSDSVQLGATISLDDGTVSTLPGSNISWSAVGYPFTASTSGGLALAMNVNADVTTTITGSCFGITKTLTLYVLDTNPAHFQIASMANLSSGRHIFIPSSAIRTYSLETTSDAQTGAWTSVTGQTGIPGSGAMISLSDTNATPTRLYRVRITAP